ncbi:hypothetical protein V1512DRAFT_212069 [Lipomyces arxii]|uniref:uncharacterized protein n=1 Tax=Lipomyces arxii TaxID=56418 RepID=UPI0034CEC9C8
METESERKARTGEYDDEDDEIRATKSQIKHVNTQTERLAGEAVALASQAMNSGMRTLGMLNEQNNQLLSVNKTLNTTQQKSIEAESNTNELKLANRSMFMPRITNPFSNEPHRREQVLDLLAQDNIALDEQGRAHGQFVNNVAGRVIGIDSRGQQASVSNVEAQYKEQRERQWREQTGKKSHMFEPDEDDFATEKAIENNLNSLAVSSGQLNYVASAINTQIDGQNTRLAGMQAQNDGVQISLNLDIARMQRYQK